ncbi:thiamine pyrophosphate-binding protein [Agromyces sp. Marseille-P2726]|uniref:thiamine pyrophosphate-binding protein n=1 Tax=Agromyces sp. Marseille-P2726 TaxID=2709132 RepID=UPI001C2D532C|nr:thiamine pyrophosphate-binding protein [Agromyces sp. Marseille-P2726]
MGERITVADAIGRTVAALGAGHVFGVVGSGNFHATNAAIAAGVPFTASRHEMGAATMADAFSRVTGRVAIVSVHQGCGLTNALTGITEAAKCHTPILVLAGDTATGDTTSNFHIDQDAAVLAIGATPARVVSAETAVTDAADAFRLALHERRTVVLSMPVDIQDELIEWDDARIPALGGPVARAADPDSIARLAQLLRHAERPVIVGGRGAWGAKAELRRLAEAGGALLTTSAAARGLFVGDEWALDIMGGFSTPGAARLIADADVIVGFGVAFNTWTTRNGTLLDGATVAQVDDRREAFGLHRPVDLAVMGDAALVAAAVADALEQGGPRTGYRRPGMRDHVRAVRYWKDQPVEPHEEPGRIDAQALVNSLDALLPLERVVVPDGGNVNCYAGAHLRVPDERGYCIPLSFQAIGMGLSAGIGAAVAQPHRTAVGGTGDGSFMMSLVELDTAGRLGPGMVVIVFNDEAYGAEVNLFQGDTAQLDTVRFPETDIAAVARGFGCHGVTVRDLDDLAPVVEWLDGPRARPLVIDAKIVRHPSRMMMRNPAVREGVASPALA